MDTAVRHGFTHSPSLLLVRADAERWQYLRRERSWAETCRANNPPRHHSRAPPSRPVFPHGGSSRFPNLIHGYGPVSLGTSRHHMFIHYIELLHDGFIIFIKLSWPESFLQVLVMLLCMPVVTSLAKTWDDAADILHCLPVTFQCSRGIYCQQLSPRYELPSVVGGAYYWHHSCPFQGHQHPMVLILSSRSLCRKLGPFLVPHTVQLRITNGWMSATCNYCNHVQ